MKLWLGFACLLFLVSGVVTQGFDLGDAVDETPAPKAPVDKPKANDDGFDLSDAFGQDPTQKPKSKPSGGNSGVDDILDTLDFGPPKATKAPRKPADNDDTGFDLADAFGPDPDPKPNKPAVNPSGGRTGSFGDFDLSDAAGDGYKPDQTGGGGRAQDPGYDPHGGSDGAGDQAQDLSLLWAQILKRLNDNMPEEVYIWISNFKQIMAPLLERAMQLLEALP
ncbi:CD99 molecule isoform X3 [Myripristis murdjan]|uniref:CD99 molecule isoform X3 n=1 Tax=Myripristis murdjan TaxID=586833 RepID=UPI0011763408|nr:CD99 antigen-like isoform X3 [Myripristis murdjan]